VITIRTLVLECLNGPLDGHQIELTAAAEWQSRGEGPLIFPWDTELGTPQARFYPELDGWYLEGYSKTPHGTYRMNGERGKIERPVRLEDGDILRASQTWLLVTGIAAG
jgi:hypothetical protein